ncbi:hypothetical protein BV25DRAFT_1920044 [Artomyces pyxidatus]|uniref:Uncharacterized protein n=1 Tax=Artomyces pyxidatus TaxID=48021 RepID=A0ACB8SMX6_9AGAM|nr:hypothetical protein BV25DRAFT_1920044 [Artomyces pyxidatus]
MARLSAPVDEFHALARAAPVEHRKPILARVAELRAAYKKQQERCIAFRQLTQEYADRYLADISDGDLRAEVVSLKSVFEKGTCAGLKSVRKAVMAVSLPDDVKLFRDLDATLKTIQTCYKDLDKFWIGEVRRVTKALKARRMAEDKVRSNGRLFTRLPEDISASPVRPSDPSVINPGQSSFVNSTVQMAPNMSAASTTLHALYHSLSPSSHELPLLRADLHLRLSRLPTTLHWLWSLGRLRTHPSLKAATDEDAQLSRHCGGAPVFHEIGMLLRKTEDAWDALCARRNTVLARVLALDDPDALIGACFAKRLSRVLRAWVKEGEVLRAAAARLGLEPFPESVLSYGAASGDQTSCAHVVLPGIHVAGQPSSKGPSWRSLALA